MKNPLHYLLPGTCVLCNMLSYRDQDLCRSCEADLPWVDTLSNNIIALFYYQYPIDHLISALKFANKLIYAKVLGELMANKLVDSYRCESLPEVIIPVPLHKYRLRERGYNQALELARPIAKQLNIPIDFSSCVRVKHTEAQTLIPAKLRQKNVKNAFEVSKNFSAQHVAIIDDVITTGNTVRELSNVLLQFGVSRIDVWCCAKTNYAV
ncbi:MAG: hypothetical protein AMJ43_04045 [Coxiella sp. DG_40]|nr:MAG: hypothetical protein AMJ43_04045 [Coxiella sp. DG_40]